MVKRLYCNNYTLTPVAKWCLEDMLKLEDYDVTVNACVHLNGKNGEFLQPSTVFISQDLDPLATVLVLFHELRHYYQHKTEMFDFNPAPYMRLPKAEWSKEKADLERYLDYLEYPWEMDARKFASEANSQFCKSPISFSFYDKASPRGELYPALNRR